MAHMVEDDFDDENVIFGFKEPTKVKPVEAAAKPESAEAPKANFSAFAAIVEMFNRAKASGVNTPKFRAEGLILSRAPDTGKNPGAIYVKRDNVDGTYVGKIVPPGDFINVRDTTKGDSDALMRICESPLDVAVAYGRKTGKCSICGRTLTNGESIKYGIGPICAEKYGFVFAAEEVTNESFSEEETAIEVEAEEFSLTLTKTEAELLLTKLSGNELPEVQSQLYKIVKGMA